MGAAFLLLRKKRKQQPSIGSSRHWLYEIAQAQRAGIDFWDDYDERDAERLESLAKANGVKLTKADVEKGITLPQKYFLQLYRKFKPLRDQIGKINYPYETAYIYNRNGDKSLIIHDYDERRDAVKALDYVESEMAGGGDDTAAYWATVVAIAKGAKFVWKDKKVHGTVTLKGLESCLFGQGDHEGERKKYFKILGNPKDAWYPEKFAEELSLSNNVLNGVLDALRSVRTPSDAIELCMDAYYKQFEEPDDPRGHLDEDLPF